MPRPRTKMRLVAEIVSASVASNRGARAPDPLALASEREPRPRGRGRVQMLRAGNGGRDAVEAIGHGDIHADNRDAPVDSGLLSERS